MPESAKIGLEDNVPTKGVKQLRDRGGAGSLPLVFPTFDYIYANDNMVPLLEKLCKMHHWDITYQFNWRLVTLMSIQGIYILHNCQMPGFSCSSGNKL